ncbi:TPA: site-specific integrase [Streptococcus suis]|uniref:tyrosine-type recombinase/integrase n=1 Tax=Streptococcus suis TaxID=1307 RepID=UPI000CF5BCF2|nr:site-specific integrase [Streptococcus suis]MCK4020379.1 site-specific integrase [Streptococcus suis]HEL9643339.1 site-specific integrase [Streptococcus suis]HEM5107455.1 site-specific integrase [Streptococcus suis]HEM5111694.1 site-specific integrase [Streptococcus suis]HEM5201514.1 site-specific integrase [Streptococcus suis]
MAISYRKRGKKNLWDYRIFDKHKKVIASNSGFRTKREAEIEALSIEIKLMQGAIIDKNITFYDLWEKWLELTVKPLGKADTTLNKHMLRGKFIKTQFEDKPAIQIKASEYQAFINKYAETNCRDNVSRMNAEIRNVIIFAKRDKLNIEDFTEGVILSGRPPKKRKEDKYIHSFKDYQKLVSYLEENLDISTSIIPHLLLIQLKTGLRAGEVAGLTWDCVLWDTLEIKTYRRYDTVRQRWSKAKTEDSIRTIPIDADTLKILKKLKQEQDVFIEDGTIINNENMIFVDVNYNIVTNAGINKHLKQILKTLRIFPQNMTSTGLRHTYCSTMLAMGVDIWAVSKLMGHKDITEITETYGHLIKEKAEIENNKVRSVLKSLIENDK